MPALSLWTHRTNQQVSIYGGVVPINPRNIMMVAPLHALLYKVPSSNQHIYIPLLPSVAAFLAVTSHFRRKPIPLAAGTHSLSHRDCPCRQLPYCSHSPRRRPWHSPGHRPGRCPCPHHASPKSCDGESLLLLVEWVLRAREIDSSAVRAACF